MRHSWSKMPGGLGSLLSRCYLEMVELACDWLEAVVAALS